MASSSSLVPLRRATATALFNSLVNPTSVVPSFTRSFNTNPDRPLSRRPDFLPSFFSDVFDPFSSTRSLNQVLNLMDQFMENPFLVAASPGIFGSRRGWNVKEDKDALFLRVDMPGLDKENVMVSVENNTLIIKGEAEKEWEDEEDYYYGQQRYSSYLSRLHLPPNVYKIDQIEAEMKNGVLKVMVPKVKEEDRKDVFQVKVVDSVEDRRRRSIVLRKTTALFYSANV